MPVPSYLNFPQDPLPPKILPQLFRNPVTTETFHQISQLQAKYALYVDSGIFSSEAFLQVFTPDVSTNYGLTLGEIQGVENLRRVIHDSSQYFGVSQHNVGTHVMGEHEDGEGVWCLTYVNTHNWMKGDDTQWLDTFQEFHDLLIKDESVGEYRIKFRHVRYIGDVRGNMLKK